MPLVKRLLAALALASALAGCSGPGPLAPGNSRIKVSCYGFAFDGTWLRARDPAGNWVGNPEKLGCFLYQSVYFDVPVPPNRYDVITADGAGYVDTVTFGGPGETKNVTVWKIIVGYTVAT